MTDETKGTEAEWKPGDVAWVAALGNGPFLLALFALTIERMSDDGRSAWVRTDTSGNRSLYLVNMAQACRTRDEAATAAVDNLTNGACVTITGLSASLREYRQLARDAEQPLEAWETEP